MTLFSASFPETSVFRSLRFHLSTLEMEHFQNNVFSEGSKASVFVSLFGHFSVDNRQKQIKRCAFSYKDTFMWSGPQ